MTESRGKLLLEQQSVPSRHADTPTRKHDLSRQRRHFLKTPKKTHKQLSHLKWEPAPGQGSGQHPKKQWQWPKFFLSKGKPKRLIKVSKDIGKQTLNQKRSSMGRSCPRARAFRRTVWNWCQPQGYQKHPCKKRCFPTIILVLFS